MCETKRVFPIMSRREFRHPHVIGQIILLSHVASHNLSFSSAPLVGRLALWGEGSSFWPSMHSSRLVWERLVDSFVLSTCPSPSFFPPTFLPLDTGGGFGPPAPVGVGVR